ncbi:MAG: VOC family protein [Balneolaceae bacterium]|nr:VOC family protein [Balneolaceae bacterium]
MKPNISHFAAIFPAKDPESLANWYAEKLGFEITFKWGEPVDYIVTNREHKVSIHFSKSDNENLQPSMLYVFCEDVDAIHAEFVKNGVDKLSALEDQEYQMRDFDVVDPVGNRLTFGMGIGEES